jgi:DNA-binding winged helix-turn-helix (wHTH) protein
MIYAFDDGELDTQLYTLRRVGQTIRLRPKVFQVLLYLLEHRDRVVSKQDLCDAVWPEQFISDATLESTLREVRRALGDSARAQRVIHTYHGHGYRFVAPVTGVAEARAGPEAQAVPAAAETPYPRRCPQCGEEHPPHATFCAACGTPLTTPSLPARQPVLQPDQPTQMDIPAPHAEPSVTERRQLTALFCDLVGSTTLARQLELEDYHSVIRAYQGTCAAVIEHFEGHIAQYLGDGMLSYFGHPQAHEDDAQRAIHAALGIVEELEALRTRLKREWGIRLAVRLQNLAAPDTVVISEVTARLVQGYFACQDLGLHR